MISQAIFLTRIPKTVFNRDTYLPFPFMGLNKIGTIIAAGSAAIMSPANAQETSGTAQAERDAVVEVTREQCLAMVERADKISCLTQLRAQREAEIAARSERVETQQAENADTQSRIEAGQAENAALQSEEAQVNATTEGLTRRIAVLDQEIEEAERKIEERVLDPGQ